MKNSTAATTIGIACLLLGISILPAGSSNADPSSELTTVRLADGSQIAGALIFVALEQGFFEEEGLNVVYEPHPFGRPALQSALNGSADFATVALTPFVNAVMSGKQPRLLASIGKARNHHGIFSLAESAIESAQDLRGKRIGVPFNTSAEYFLNMFLNLNGILLNEVIVVDVPPHEMAAALRQGHVDAVSLWEMELSQLQAAFDTPVRIFNLKSAVDFYWTLSGAAETVAQNPAAVRKLIRALVRAEDWCKTNSDRCRSIAARYLNIDPVMVEAAWPEIGTKVSVNQSLLIACENQARWYLTHKDIGGQIPNFLHYFSVEPLREVSPQRLSLIE